MRAVVLLLPHYLPVCLNTRGARLMRPNVRLLPRPQVLLLARGGHEASSWVDVTAAGLKGRRCYASAAMVRSARSNASAG